METIQNFILGLDFFDLLFALLFLLVGPILLWSLGADELKSKYGRQTRGKLYKVGAAALALADIALTVLFGKDIWFHIANSFGPTMKGLLIVTIACVALFPVCYAGSMFRGVYKAVKIVRADPSKRITHRSLRNTTLSGVVLIIITTAGFLFLPIKMALILGGAIIIALIVGWWGSFLVPDIGP